MRIVIEANELIAKAGLTERQVRFLIGYYFEGFYEREIGEQEGCSRPTVSVELKKARAKLKEAGFPEPTRLKRPEVHFFASDKLNTLTKRAAGFWQWTEHDRH